MAVDMAVSILYPYLEFMKRPRHGFLFGPGFVASRPELVTSRPALADIWPRNHGSKTRGDARSPSAEVVGVGSP